MSFAKYRKIVLLGHHAVGKTALTQHFVREEFPQQYQRSVDNISRKTFTLGLAEYELDIVDTEGQVEYSYIPESYISGVDGYIVVYSVDSIRSTKDGSIVVYSVDSSRSYQIATGLYRKLAGKRGIRHLPIILVGNKKDVPTTCRHIKREEGKRLADVWNVQFLEVSAKNLEDCKEVFTKIIEEIDGVQRPLPPAEGRKRCQLM